MLVAGAAWGIYSLRGKGTRDPASATAGNFLRAVPLAAVLSLAFFPWMHVDRAGIVYAILSGAIASGGGYVLWYSALPGLRATSAATVQLSVPVLAAAGGILLLGEPTTFRFLLAVNRGPRRNRLGRHRKAPRLTSFFLIRARAANPNGDEAACLARYLQRPGHSHRSLLSFFPNLLRARLPAAG